MSSGTNLENIIASQLATLAELHKQEQSAVANLQTLQISNSSQTVIQNQVSQIRQLAQTRRILYVKLRENLNLANNDIKIENESTLLELDSVNKTLDITNAQLDQLQNPHTLNMRKTEINDYYIEQYTEKTNIIKTVILICVPILLLTLLKNKGFLPDTIYIGLVTIVSMIGLFFVSRSLLMYNSHDNIVFQQYDWNFNKANAPAINTTVS